MGQAERTTAPIAPRLSLWDTVSIIVGIIVGVGIYKVPAEVFSAVTAPWQVLAVWLLGGVLSLLGALTIAELASTYPRSGGEYVYLTRAYGPPVGFLFAWAQLVVIRPGGGIAMPAYILAEAADRLWDLGAVGSIGVAVLVIALLTFINILGANPGKHAQNLFTIAKVLSLVGIVGAGFFLARPRSGEVAPAASQPVSFVVMMMAVLYAYDGWNEAAYVSAEVRERRRNLPLALLLGTSLVTLIYLMVNAAYIVGFGFETARTQQVGADDILKQALGEVGGQVMDIVIMISVLGALTGMIFTGSRLFSELGADHRLFAPLGWWHARLGTPVWSLTIQAAISIAMVIGVAVYWRGEGAFDVKEGFEALLKGTAPVFWLFFLLTGMSLFVLRYKDPHSERPFRVPLYPVVPALFCAWSGFMLCGSLRDARPEAFVGLAVLLLGLPLYLLSRSLERPAPAVDSAPLCDSLVGNASASHPGDEQP